MSKPSHTTPTSPPPGHEDQSARLAASAWVDQEGGTSSIFKRAFTEAGLESLKEFMCRPEVVVMTRRAPVGVNKLAKVACCRPRMTAREGVYGIEHLRHALPDDESRLRLSCACGGFVISRSHVDASWIVVSDGGSFA